MKEYTKSTPRPALIARLILVAFSIGVFAAPNTLADSGPKKPRACSSAGNPRDFTSHDWFAGSFLRRDSESAHGSRTASPAMLAPAAAPLAPAQSSCAPQTYCLFAGCWYELLNNSTFDEPTCTPDWVFPSGYTLSSTTLCNGMPYPVYSNAAVLPGAAGFYQDFYVPTDAGGPLQASVIFTTIGKRPTSPSDRITLELRENGLLVEQKSISTYLGPFDCHRVDLTFSNSYAGRNLRLRVKSTHVTLGVNYYIDSISVTSRR